MTSYKDLKKKAEESTRIAQEIYKLRCEIYNLQEIVGYLEEHNLTYYDGFVQTRLHINELRNLVRNRKQELWYLENFR